MTDTNFKAGDKVTWMLKGKVEVNGCTVVKVGKRIRIECEHSYGTTHHWVPPHNLTKEAA